MTQARQKIGAAGTGASRFGRRAECGEGAPYKVQLPRIVNGPLIRELWTCPLPSTLLSKPSTLSSDPIKKPVYVTRPEHQRPWLLLQWASTALGF